MGGGQYFRMRVGHNVQVEESWPVGSKHLTRESYGMSYLGPVAAVQRVVSHWASHEGAEPCAEGRADPGPPPTTILSPATNHNRQQVSHLLDFITFYVSICMIVII